MSSVMIAGRCLSALAALLVTLLVGPPVVSALEYGLQVVSLYDEAFASLLRANEFVDGASGPGLDNLEVKLDRAEFPPGAILWDRQVHGVSAAVARAYGAVAVDRSVPVVRDRRLWHELRWEGRPGEQSVWKVSPNGLRVGELGRVALKGQTVLTQFLPFTVTTNGRRAHAVSVPLLYLSAEEERGSLWRGYLARNLDISDGIAAIVGVNANRSFADQVYLLVRHAEQPTTYKAVLSWRPRDRSHLNDLEAPGADQTR